MSNRSFLIVTIVVLALLAIVVVMHRPRGARAVHSPLTPAHGDVR